MQRVNYDQIAHVYDEPLRDHELDPNLIAFFQERSETPPDSIRILDMGCGTGKQLSANRREYPHLFMAGLDCFHGMLQQAQARCETVAWIQADSASPPFPDNSFDYITNQFSYPHVLEKRKMIRATSRLLRPGGRFVMTNIDPWRMPGWILYRYFPAAQRRDFEDFLPIPDFVGELKAAGFARIETRYADQIIREELKRFWDYASQRFRTSQLMMISDQDYQTGLERLKEEIDQLGEGASVDSEFCLVTVTGDKENALMEN